MPDCRYLKDDALIAESYYVQGQSRLLLETPATEANIARFVKKYLDQLVPRLSPETYRSYATDFLNQWTPRVQQIIKAAGGNPDVFGYSGLVDLMQARDSTVLSKTNVKKSYKQAADVPIIYETHEYVVYQPHTWEASRKFFGETRVSLLDGQVKRGSHWCTAASEPLHFNRHVLKDHDRLLYFARKSDDALFAARFKNLIRSDNPWTHSITSDEIYEKWYEEKSSYDIPDLLYIIEKLRALPYGDNHLSQQFFLKQRVQEIMRHMAPEEFVYECRDETNGIITLEELYRGLVEIKITSSENIALYAEKYISFVSFVVFGKKD